MNRNPDLVAAEEIAGISFHGAVEFLKPEWKRNFNLAMDAQPALVTVGNSGIPSFLATFVDPDLLRILTSPNAAAKIFGEVRKGSFADVSVVFPIVEHTGEVSSYGDFSANGRSGANTNFPQREAYLYQTVVEYGELEMERAGLAKIGWAAELKQSATVTLNKYQNLTYFYGVAGLQNYGVLNDPSLSAPLSPAPKAAGGLKWWANNVLNATANEIFADIQSLFVQLVQQSGGLVDNKTPMTLAMSPTSAAALTSTNSFNVNVEDLLKKNFPSLTVETAVQYGALSAQNPQGSTGGEVMQLIAKSIEGQETAYCAFNEKMRAGPVVRGLSSYAQKMSQGTWGAVIRQPFAISQMIGL